MPTKHSLRHRAHGYHLKTVFILQKYAVPVVAARAVRHQPVLGAMGEIRILETCLQRAVKGVRGARLVRRALVVIFKEAIEQAFPQQVVMEAS